MGSRWKWCPNVTDSNFVNESIYDEEQRILAERDDARERLAMSLWFILSIMAGIFFVMACIKK